MFKVKIKASNSLKFSIFKFTLLYIQKNHAHEEKTHRQDTIHIFSYCIPLLETKIQGQ